MELLIATRNPGKLREMSALLAGAADVRSPLDFPAIPEPEETGTAYWENARLKALAYAAATGLMTVADDSGLEVHALDGGPGVYSARFLGAGVPFSTRFTEIFRRLDAGGLPRDARFVAAVAVAQGREILYETEASVDGVIAHAPDGANGFGYDPIFLYPPFGKTTAACSDDEKASVSHRGRALRNVAWWLRAQR